MRFIMTISWRFGMGTPAVASDLLACPVQSASDWQTTGFQTQSILVYRSTENRGVIRLSDRTTIDIRQFPPPLRRHQFNDENCRGSGFHNSSMPDSLNALLHLTVGVRLNANFRSSEPSDGGGSPSVTRSRIVDRRRC